MENHLQNAILGGYVSSLEGIYILNTDYLGHDGLEGIILVGGRNISKKQNTQGLLKLEMFERNDRKVQTIIKSATYH